jgi:hypothetical protein
VAPLSKLCDFSSCSDQPGLCRLKRKISLRKDVLNATAVAVAMETVNYTYAMEEVVIRGRYPPSPS